jgi:hypothetical protein
MLLFVVAVGLIWPASGAAADDVEEVVVTARKREESILKVPVIEAAITEQQLT